MKWFPASVFCGCLVAMLLCGMAAGADDRFRIEGDAFLSTIPDGWQQAQAEAIRNAIKGDCVALNEIRTGRNAGHVVPAGVEVCDMGNLRLYRPAGKVASALPLLIYFHGGGWTIGSINSCAEFCCDIVAPGGVAVLAVDYPLAPEHPFPAGLDACMDALEMARKHAGEWGVDASRISVGGDSSGGNLALAVAIRALLDDVHDVHSVVAFYPVVCAWNDGSGSWNRYGSGFALDGDYMEAFNEAYTHESNDFLVSPMLAPDSLLCRMPPTLILGAERDILCDSGRQFALKLQELGVDVAREELEGAVHLFITVGGQPSARRYAVERTRSFLIKSGW